MTVAATRYSAPGKVVLCGEYAVLHGAPALAMAVNRRARVTLAATPEPGLLLHAPGFDDGTHRFRIPSPGVVEWCDEAPRDGRHGLFESVVRETGATFTDGTAVTLDTREFSDGDRKLGLGSSAALAVALTAACGGAMTTAAGEAAVACAHRAHSRFQGEQGSGVDVAVAQFGGLIEFRATGLSTAARDWPPGLYPHLLWSGRSASTPERLRRLQASLRDAMRHASLQALAAAADAVAAAFRAGDAKAVLENLAVYSSALRRFDRDQELDIFGAGHAAVAEAAVAAGLVYKPCGAGGGDIGAVFGTDPGAVAAFAEAAAELGFTPLDIVRDAAGVQLDGQDD